MKDLISKNDLLEELLALEELARLRVLDTPTSSPFYDRYSAQLNERTSLKHLVADFPVVQGIDKWIPVSERLPTIKECQENDCRFIVTDGNRRYQNWFDYEDNYFDRCACNGLGLKRDSCVIAWQPLPELYKEVSE